MIKELGDLIMLVKPKVFETHFDDFQIDYFDLLDNNYKKKYDIEIKELQTFYQKIIFLSHGLENLQSTKDSRIFDLMRKSYYSCSRNYVD